MKLLVTGASGLVGRGLLNRFAKREWSGVAVSRRQLDDLPAGWRWLHRSTALQAAVPSDWVLHLEVKHHTPSPDPADLDAFEQVNHQGTRDWLDWCRRQQVRRFIFFSSIKAVQPSQLGPTDESASGPGESAYGASKWRAEQAVSQWASEDPARIAIILRPAVIYGPGSTANIYSLLSGIARRRFFLIGSAANVKSVVSLRNVVEAVVYLLDHPPKGCETYNLVDPECFSVHALANLMARELGVALPPFALPVPAARFGAAIGDFLCRWCGLDFPLTTARLQALLEETRFSGARLLATGYRPPQTTEEGIREFVGWFRSACH